MKYIEGIGNKYRLDTETMGSMGFRNPKALGCGREGTTKGLRVSKAHRSHWWRYLEYRHVFM